MVRWVLLLISGTENQTERLPELPITNIFSVLILFGFVGHDVLFYGFKEEKDLVKKKQT